MNPDDMCKITEKVMKDMTKGENVLEKLETSLHISAISRPLEETFSKAMKIDKKLALWFLSVVISTVILVNVNGVDEAVALNDELHKKIKSRLICVDKALWE